MKSTLLVAHVCTGFMAGWISQGPVGSNGQYLRSLFKFRLYRFTQKIRFREEAHTNFLSKTYSEILTAQLKAFSLVW